VPGFPADESDSQCIPALQTFVKNLNKSNHFYLSIITLYYPQFKKKYVWHGTRIYSLAGKPGIIKKIPILFKVYTTFNKIHRENPVDIIHSFWLQDTSWVGRKLSQKYHIPHLSTAMGQDVLGSNKYLSLLPLGKMRIITLNKFHQDRLLKNTGKESSQNIPWGIDSLDFPSFSKERTIDLIGIGNLTPLKNFNLFITAVAGLLPRFPNLKAILIGDGPEQNNLQKRINDEGLKSNISLLGSLPREEVLFHLSKSKLLLHPSTFESFGFVFAEALQLGVKIVSYEVGIAKNGRHWSIFNNVEEMVKMTADLLSSPAISESTNNYQIQDTISAYEAVYQKLIAIK
jgi:glycosyltransferase involved in cell wall biosynthesis